MARRTIRLGPLAVDLYEPEGPPRCVLLYSHGFGSHRQGQKVIALGEALVAHGAAMIAPDLQGHGESEGEFGAITILRSIRDLLRCAELPLFREAPRRMLGGSSFGALTALWASVDHPELCERLFLIAPAFGFIERHVAGYTPEEVERWRAGELARIERDWFSVDLQNDILLETEERQVAELAKRLRHPALMVHGKCDETVPWQDVVGFFRDCEAPGLELHLIGDGDHRLTDHLPTLTEQLIRFAGLIA